MFTCNCVPCCRARTVRDRYVHACVQVLSTVQRERKKKHLFSLVRGVVMLVPLLPLAAMALPLCRLFSCARDALHGNSSHGVALAGAVDARHGVLVRGGPWRGAAACPRLSLGKFLEMGSGVRYHHRCRSGGGGCHACMQASCARYEPSNPSCPESGDETNDESVLATVAVKSARRRICSRQLHLHPVAAATVA